MSHLTHVNLSHDLRIGYFCHVHIQDKAAEVEHNFISGEDRALFTTTTFIVSSSQTSPEYDMCVTVTIDGGKTPHTVITVERKASRRCVCQVFYQREEINCWKTTLAFCPERLLDVSCMETVLHTHNNKSDQYYLLV